MPKPHLIPYFTLIIVFLLFAVAISNQKEEAFAQICVLDVCTEVSSPPLPSAPLPSIGVEEPSPTPNQVTPTPTNSNSQIIIQERQTPNQNGTANSPIQSPSPTGLQSIIVTEEKFPNRSIQLAENDTELIFTPENLTADSPGWTIVFPRLDINVILNFNALLVDDQVKLPEKITITKPAGDTSVIITLPKDLSISSDGEPAWDGKFFGPKTITAGQTCSSKEKIELAIEVGLEDRKILFSGPVDIEFAGKANYIANYCDGENSMAIASECPEDYQNCVSQPGNNLLIKTKHFSQFQIYKKASLFWVWVMTISTVVLLIIGFGVFFVTKRVTGNNSTENISMVAHELRTPLTTIKGYLAMLLKGNFGPVKGSQKTPLTKAASSAQKLSDMVNEVLDISKIKAGKLKVVTTEFQLSKLITDTIDSLQFSAKEKGIAFKIGDIMPNFVRADENKVSQILTNLIGNAIKYTDKGYISVSTKKEGAFARISVADTGHGITKSDSGKIFGKFEQGSAKTQKPGTGLGLYISREMARKMGGDVVLEKSEPNIGSTFSLVLPIASKKAKVGNKESK